MALVVLPNQMFDKTQLELKQHHVIFIEEPLLFGDVVKPSLIKIAYMRACMRHMYDRISIKDKTYVEYKDARRESQLSTRLKAYPHVYMYDPTDHAIMSKYRRIIGSKNIRIMPSPNFIASMQWLQEYRQQHPTPRHASFYGFMQAKMGMHPMKNMDTHNRVPLKHGVHEHVQMYESRYHQEAIQYARDNFGNHIGDPTNVVQYPICHEDAFRHLQAFLREKLATFGPYQDAVQEDAVVLYHARISAAMNVGILCPTTVVDATLSFWKAHPSVPLASVEGFLRQVIGWREFMRYLYLFYYPEIVRSNLANNTQRLDARAWYGATTGMYPLDNEIRKALDHGYAHHIVRLMFFLNQMILRRTDPHDIYKWFMEVVSIDAYDWVMVPNIWAMGYFWPGAMRKPYISSSNYVLKMSNYHKDGQWDVIWTQQYHTFVNNAPRAYVKAYRHG